MSMSEIQQAIQDADAKFSKMVRELESLRQERDAALNTFHSANKERLELRQENSRLRKALGEIASDGEFIRDCSPMHLAMIANRALNPPKNR